MKRLLVDTGPLFAMFEPKDAAHGECVAYLKGVSAELVTTWPVVTETMYLLGSSWPSQNSLLRMVSAEDLTIADIGGVVGRIEHLMEKYHDVPMDFADASLVAIAEENGWGKIFTLDSDFRVYRFGRSRAFEMVP